MPYRATCAIYAAVVCLVYALTFPEENLPAATSDSTPAAVPLGSRWHTALTLLPLVLFFVGGLMVASHLSVFVTLANATADSMAVFGVAKIAGAAVLVGTLLVWRRDSLARLLFSGAALAGACLLLSGSWAVPVLAIVVAFEVALNIAGASFMGEVARDGSAEVQRFIPWPGSPASRSGRAWRPTLRRC
ncbi:MAG: hypothetical protein AcusKO_15740 [Acuticoccus sp.]